MDEKGVFDAGAVWFAALGDFGEGLFEQVAEPGADRLRFQTGLLFSSLVRRIKAEVSGKDEWGLLFACYEFVTNCSRHLGYDEARRLHGGEMAARRLASAKEFCSGMPRRFAVEPEGIFLEELRSRVRSVAWWMECQESFSVWLVFKGFHRGWRGTREERARAVAVLYLSRLHKGAEWARGVRRGYGGVRWSEKQWENMLRMAANLVGKRFECTELEKWVWWCYPVFWRYRWNVREVLEAASKRGMDFEEEKEGVDQVMVFQKDWIRRGLRFSGGKQRMDRVLPLTGFVERMVLPDPRAMWGEAGGLLFSSEK